MADEKKKKAPVSASFLSTTASTHLPAASVSSVLPPNALGQRFLEAIQYKPLEEKHLFGYSISKVSEFLQNINAISSFLFA